MEAELLVEAAVRSSETRLARTLVAGFCGYETFAISTGVVPTLSTLMWKCPTATRMAIWAGVALLATDHFFWRRFS